jgi:hypothetical protein
MRYFSYSVQWKMFHLVVADNRQLAAVQTFSKNSIIDSFTEKFTSAIENEIFSDSEDSTTRPSDSFTVKYVLYDYFLSL